MKKTYLLLTICCALMACKKIEVDFSFSPEEPRAGQLVSFSNLSSSGEDWEWTFGDGSTSTLKNPTHTYRQPGKYMASLKVDKKKSLTASKEITIYDTIPTFVASDSVFSIYQDYTFTANIYNPYNYEIKYQWAIPQNTGDGICAVVTDTTMTNSTLHLYFVQPMFPAVIELTMTVNGVDVFVRKEYNVDDTPAHSVLMRTDEFDYRQRIFGDRAEFPWPDLEGSAAVLLDIEQDTMQTYNGHTFYLSDMVAIDGILGFHIANRKLYYRATGGLWVANIDGANKVQIDSTDCAAMTLDLEDNRIYWANEFGVWYMPFVGSDNNKFVTTPQLLNDMPDVTQIAIDYELQ